MSRATRDSAAARSLLARVESRSTGKLTVGAGAAEIAVYLLDGDVVAATAADDDRQVVRMLLALGEIDEATAARVTARLDDGGDGFQGLLDVGDTLDQVLAERFRQNLADYLASPSAPRFLDQRALFVTNIQMGHDTRRLVDEVALQCDVAKAIAGDLLVTRGRVDPGPDPQRRRVADSVRSATTVAVLLDGLALEPLRARVLVGELLATGVLIPAVSASAETEVEVEFEPSEEFPTAYLDEDTLSAERDPTPVLGRATRTDLARTEPARTEPVRTEPVRAEPVRAEPVRAEPARAEPVRAEPPATEPGRPRAPGRAPDPARRDRPDRPTQRPPSGANLAEPRASEPRASASPSRAPAPVGRPKSQDFPLPGRGLGARTPAALPERALSRTQPVARSGGRGPAGWADAIDGVDAYEDRDTTGPDAEFDVEVDDGPAPGEATRALPEPWDPALRAAPKAGSTILPFDVDDGPAPSPRFRRAHADDEDEDVDDDRTEQIDPKVYARQQQKLQAQGSPSGGPQGHTQTPPVSSGSIPRSAAGSSPTAHGRGGLADWLNRTEEAGDDDEVAMFSDHDHERGKDGTGQFRTDRHNLDRVEVGVMEDDRGAPEGELELEVGAAAEVIEVDEAPVSRYGAPVLGTADALAKIDVTNEVLAVVAAAFDDASGPGRGRAMLQLMVDGVPSLFAVVLHDLRVSETGEVDGHQILRNLDARPATEHRQLLNNSLSDLIERSLSAAADELPDDAFDTVLATVAGYRQRLGL